MNSMPWPARLYALVRHGAQSADLSGLPVWPAAWALSQQLSEEQLASFPSASPQRLALTMQRRKARRAGPHPLDHCLHQSARALHPVQRLAWLMVLVESHGEKAIEPLLKSLGVALNRPSPFVELGEALAWALGQLGRDILLPIGDRFKDAPFLVREHYCQALWYLGPQARGCQGWMKAQHTEWAEAVLYRLEALGSDALIERRRVPVWLDNKSLDQLADLVFSQEPGDRLYALRALDGWGPARSQAARLVRATLADSDEEVVLQAWRTLLSLGERPEASDVSRALRSQHGQLAQLANDHCALLLGPQPPMDSLEASVADKDEFLVDLALARLLARPFPSDRLRRFLALLNRLHAEQQRQAARWLVRSDWWAEDWARMVELEPANSYLLDAIAERADATIQLYLQPALRQRLVSRLEGIPGGEELKKQLQGDCLTWERLGELRSERRNQALDAILKTGELSEPLLQPILEGRAIHPESLELLVKMSPGELLESRLRTSFAASPSQARQHFDQALRLLEDKGWETLLSWLRDPHLAQAAADLTEFRLTRSLESLENVQPSILEAAGHEIRARWQWIWAKKVCCLDFPGHLEWASQLSQVGDSQAALLALEFLNEHFSVSERPRVLNLTVGALKHRERAVRIDAIRHLRLNAPLPQDTIAQILQLPPDSDPLIERARRNLLDELRLSPAQRLQLYRLDSPDSNNSARQ